MPARAVVVGLDVGGTSVKGGLVDCRGNLVGDVVTFSARSDERAEVILAAFEEGLRRLWQQAGDHPVAGMGVGMPGPFDYDRGVSLIKNLGKYDALYGLNLGDAWRERLALPPEFPIRFLNDAVAFALGEVYYGVARNVSRVMAITLGTGCGSAFVVDGEPVREGEGTPPGGSIYGLPFRDGIVDDWLSRRGILRLWRSFHPTEQGASGEDAGLADVVDLARLALAGDEDARRLFAAFGEVMAEALAPAVASFRPDCLVIGGQIAKSFPLFGPRLVACLNIPEVFITPAADIDGAAIKGAASYAWHSSLGNHMRSRSPVDGAVVGRG